MVRVTRQGTGKTLLALALACTLAAPLVAQKKSAPTARSPRKPPTVRELSPVAEAQPGRRTPGAQGQEDVSIRQRAGGQPPLADAGPRIPREHRLNRASPFDGDLRSLPQTRPARVERPEREGPEPNPITIDPGPPGGAAAGAAPVAPATTIGALAAPPPSSNFEGLDFNTWGSSHPPDTNGDVGPGYFIQSINTSLGVFDKVTGTLVTAVTFNTFMSQGHFGNVCDTNNFGDPVVLYDTFDDRWVITDFAYVLSGGNVIPPAMQCFAVSRSGDPIAGGWNFYSIEAPNGLGDYPKFGVWPDGLYMSANMFGYPANSSFLGTRVFALNKAQMYAGATSVQVVSFDAPPGDSTLLPANARLQTGTPAAGTPNYFLSTSVFSNALTVYKFHVDWNRTDLSTFTGPSIPLANPGFPPVTVPNAPSQGGNSLDVLPIRAMMQNQYTNIGGAESLWATHTVRRENTAGFAAPRWYQVNVTGGTVAGSVVQVATWDPDGANVMHRFMPSLAVNRQGDMALGYSTSSATTKPAIKYAGRLAGDPINTFSQTEQTLIQGTGTQTGNCNGTCTRWGDYSAMTLDPDGCTFWYTNMYYVVDGLNHHTRFGSFVFPNCAPAGTGAIQGTVTSSFGAPLANATVALGARIATTDGSGYYQFIGLPAGTYPSLTASLAGYGSQTSAGVDVPAGGTTVQNFTLAPTPGAACLTDTTQSDFQLGTAAGCTAAASPDNVILTRPRLDQQQLNSAGNGSVISTTQWIGQTFVPAAGGPLSRLDLLLFCSGCAAPNPAITVEVRTASGGLPTSTILATATIPGFSSGTSQYYTVNFASPPVLTAGTQYAYTLRLVTNRTTGVYAGVFSTGPAAYASGDRVLSATMGATWVIPTTILPPGTPATARDLAFRTYIDTYTPSGTFVSSLKDANPAAGATPTWLAINWTASTPAGTNVRFQAAASNSPAGPFTFVGPSGTPATFFADGDSLSQFNGNRYLKYRALLDTTNPNATPVLNDVTICYENVRTATALQVDPVTGPYNGSATLSATLTAGGIGLGGRTIAFALNGSAVGTAVTNAVGVATLAGVSLAGITAGTYPGGVTASFAGDLGYTPATAANVLTITRLPQTIAFDPLPPRTYGDPDFDVSATATSGLEVAFTASGQCTITGATVHLTGAGACTIIATQPGNDTYSPAEPVARAFDIARASLVVKADDKTKLFNAPNPPLTGTVTGVVNGDGITATYSTPAVTDSPVGTYPIVPAIVDPNGRLANYDAQIINGTLSILFDAGGATCLGSPGHQVLPPLAANGSSVFNRNRTVPVKFRVCDALGASIGTPGVVQSFLLIRIVNGGTVTNVSQAPVSTNGDTEFRWDPVDRQWIFNLSTKPLEAGMTYVYRIALADGSAIEFSFALR